MMNNDTAYVNHEIKMCDIKLYMSSINGDMSHTYGNAVSIVKNEILSKFPKEFFKTINVSSRIAIRQRQQIRNLLDLKHSKPILGIQPRLNVDRTQVASDFVRRMYGTTMYDLVRPDYHNEKFFKDVDRNIYIDFSIERASMEFDTIIMVGTEYQQYNLATHMLNNIRIDTPYYLPCTMEIPIPQCILERLSIDSGISIYDENNSVSSFLRYLNNISRIPITYKMQNSKQKYNFFMVIYNDMLIKFEPFSMQDGNMDGQISDSFDISMGIKCEFNYPNAFFYISKNNNLIVDEDINDKLMGMSDEVSLQYLFDRSIIPERKNEKSLFETFTFAVDKNGVDELNISEIIDPLHLEILNNMTEKERYNKAQKFIDVIIFEDGRMIDETEYTVDWGKFNLYLTNCNTERSYKLIIYINNNIVNDYIIKTNNNKYEALF